MSAQQRPGKYGTIQPRILEWEREHQVRRPEMSIHLLVGHTTDELGRWDARTTWDSCSPEHAWDNGIDVSFLRTSDDLMTAGKPPADSVMYYYEETEMGENEVVLIERNNIVTTVLLVGRFNPVLRRMLRSLRGLIEE